MNQSRYQKEREKREREYRRWMAVDLNQALKSARATFRIPQSDIDAGTVEEVVSIPLDDIHKLIVFQMREFLEITVPPYLKLLKPLTRRGICSFMRCGDPVAEQGARLTGRLRDTRSLRERRVLFGFCEPCGRQVAQLLGVAMGLEAIESFAEGLSSLEEDLSADPPAALIEAGAGT